MIALIQRVRSAHVEVEQTRVAEIGPGMLVLVGVEKTDTPAVASKLARKLASLRMFSDSDGKMNLNLLQSEGELLLVSQFTLVADVNKGNRPGFSNAAPPELGEQMYQSVIEACNHHGLTCATGRFGADMQVALVNDGPVTFHLQIN